METNNAAAANETTANTCDYNVDSVFPGDIVVMAGRRRRYLVVGVEYFGHSYRVNVQALGGAVAGSSGCVNVSAVSLSDYQDSRECYGARKANCERAIAMAAINHCNTSELKMARENAPKGASGHSVILDALDISSARWR